MKAVLDHIGIAVSDLPASLALFRDTLGLHLGTSEEIASQNVRAHFLSTGQSSLELLEVTAPDSPIAKYWRSAVLAFTTSLSAWKILRPRWRT